MHAHLNGTGLTYTTHGHGRPLLVLHGGLGLDHDYLRPWLDPLGDRAQLIYLDYHGGRADQPVNVAAWADEAEALRAYLGYDRIQLFGHSLGGFVAQEYALRYGTHLESLVVCCGAPTIDYHAVAAAHARARTTPGPVRSLLRSLARTGSADDGLRHMWTSVLPLYFKLYDTPGSDAEAGLSGFPACPPDLDVLARLRDIALPILLLAGRHDTVSPPAATAEPLHAALPRSELIVFEESGHFPFIEEKDAFVHTVGAWLNRWAA